YTLHEYLTICLRDGQMVRALNEDLCTSSSPRKCNGCFPNHSAQEFFLRKRFLMSHLELVDLFLAPSRFLRQRFIEWGLPADGNPAAVSCKARQSTPGRKVRRPPSGSLVRSTATRASKCCCGRWPYWRNGEARPPSSRCSEPLSILSRSPSGIVSTSCLSNPA